VGAPVGMLYRNDRVAMIFKIFK